MFNDSNVINDQLSVFENIHGIMRVKVRPGKGCWILLVGIYRILSIFNLYEFF